MGEWFRPLEDIKDALGFVRFKRNKTYAIQCEEKNRYLVSINPNDVNCNQCCRFLKKDEGIVYEVIDYQLNNK